MVGPASSITVAVPEMVQPFPSVIFSVCAPGHKPVFVGVVKLAPDDH